MLGGHTPLPSYQGSYQIQEVVTAGGVIKTDGQCTIPPNFVALDADHHAPAFSEKAVHLVNSIAVDTGIAADMPSTLSIKLELTMDSSKAAGISTSPGPFTILVGGSG